jgi:hypothetical protein
LKRAASKVFLSLSTAILDTGAAISILLIYFTNIKQTCTSRHKKQGEFDETY